MLGYKLPQGLIRPDIVRKAYERLRNEEMAPEFSTSPKDEASQENLMWFEEHCPNQFIANCIRKVIRRAQALSQEYFVNKDTDGFMYYYLESTAVLDVYYKWRDTPEVLEALQKEKKSLELWATEQGLEIKDRDNQEDVVEPPGDEKDKTDRPVDQAGRKLASLDDVLRIVTEVGKVPGVTCTFCEGEALDKPEHSDNCVVKRSKEVGPWLEAKVKAAKDPVPEERPEPTEDPEDGE